MTARPFLRLVDTLQATALPPVRVESQEDPKVAGRIAYRISAFGLGAREAVQEKLDQLTAKVESYNGLAVSNFIGPHRIDGGGYGALGEIIVRQAVPA